MTPTVFVSPRDVRSLVKACDASSVELGAFMRGGLLELAEMVKKDITPVYQGYSPVGAASIVAKVTRPGTAVVAQTMRKSRTIPRRRRKFGDLMMRTAFMPALEKNRERINAGVDVLIDRIATRHWEGA